MASEQAIRFGATVKALRQSVGITQLFLAEKIGIHQTQIGRMESGRAEPDLQRIYALAEFFGVGVADLLDGTAVRPVPKISVTSSVSCEECGIVGSGLTADKARQTRADHIRSHLAGGES